MYNPYFGRDVSAAEQQTIDAAANAASTAAQLAGKSQAEILAAAQQAVDIAGGKIASSNQVTPVSTGTMDTLSTASIPKKSEGFQPDRDIYGQVLYRNPYGTGEYRDNSLNTTFNDTFRNDPYWGALIQRDTVRLPDSEKLALINQALASNPSSVDNSVTPASTSAMKALDTIATTGTPDIYSEYIEPFTRQNLLNSTLTDPKRIAQLQRSASEDATKNLTPAQITAAQGQAAQLAKLNTSALGTGDVNKLVTSPASTSPSNAMNTGSIPALTTADLASWSKSLPQGITSDQLNTALQGQQTALTSQNANFLKDWNTSADALKTSILSGVDTKNQQFGTQATQGFMDAFKNFQIPTNQQTGVNLGNYNDNRNAAADQWWSQYVTGRR